jgi:hypothetical protein
MNTVNNKNRRKLTTTRNLEEFKKDVAEMYWALKYTVEELRGFRGDDRTNELVRDSLSVLKVFEKNYLHRIPPSTLEMSSEKFRRIEGEETEIKTTGSGCYSEGIISTGEEL